MTKAQSFPDAMSMQMPRMQAAHGVLHGLFASWLTLPPMLEICVAQHVAPHGRLKPRKLSFSTTCRVHGVCAPQPASNHDNTLRRYRKTTAPWPPERTHSWLFGPLLHAAVAASTLPHWPAGKLILCIAACGNLTSHSCVKHHRSNHRP